MWASIEDTADQVGGIPTWLFSVLAAPPLQIIRRRSNIVVKRNFDLVVKRGEFMEQLLEMILAGGLRLPLFEAEWMQLDRALPKSDLVALLVLQRRGAATMSELAADLGAPLSTATGIGARLERRGLVERERHPEDRRVSILQLTEDGRTLVTQVRGHLTGLLDRIQAVLTPEELQQMLGFIRRVITALQSPVPAVAESEMPTQTRVRRIAIDD
jgi:DNA-binding MarR family transcriptional regulator